MTTVLEDTASALYTTLSGGTALTALLSGGTASIYGDAPPDDADYEFVMFTHSGGGPENVNPSLLENNVWLVQAFSDASAKTAAEVFAQVDALLHRKTLTIGSRDNIWCARETNIKLTEVDPAGARIWRCGGYYRIRTSG